MSWFISGRTEGVERFTEASRHILKQSILECADAHARQRVEAFRERVTSQIIATVMIEAMAQEYGDTEDQEIDESDIHIAEQIAAAIRALEP